MNPDIDSLKYRDTDNFFLIAGPCVVESEELVNTVASRVAEISDRLEIPCIFKASYRKANRSRHDSFTGIGDEAALNILKKAGERFDLPVITDIHSAKEAAIAAQYADVLQIPAFLCRQTDILEAAADTGKYINIKKGQFLSATSMKFAVEKVFNHGNNKVMLTDRGNTFGYSDLVVDFRNIPLMKQLGVPVIMDVTHSLQQPNREAGITGGQPEMIETIARAAIAAGVDGIFLETHPEPAKALSDGANMLQLDMLESLLRKLLIIRKAALSADKI